MPYKIASNLYTRYVKGTENGAIVQDVQIFLCNLTQAVVKGIDCHCVRVYIGTRAKLKNENYICSLQEVLKEGTSRRCEIATFFRVRKEAYIGEL